MGVYFIIEHVKIFKLDENIFYNWTSKGVYNRTSKGGLS